LLTTLVIKCGLCPHLECKEC